MSTPVSLAQCEKLSTVPYEECTSFTQFVFLKPRQSPKIPGKPGGVATLPGDYKLRDPRIVAAIALQAREGLRKLKLRLPVVEPGIPPTKRKVPIAGLGEVLITAGALSQAQRLRAMKALFPEATNGGPGPRRLALPSGNAVRTISWQRALLAPIIDAVRLYAKISTSARSQAVWAIGMDYRQCWTSLGYVRGRLVRSLPLTPGEQLEIVIKTWDRRSVRNSEVNAVARNLSTEVTGEEKWMLATKMQFSDQTNASINPSMGVNADVTIPIETVTATLGGELGIAGSFSTQLSQSTETSTDFIQSTTIKTAQSLSATRTNSVEIFQEAGEEATQKQIIANTNRSHTLTYHYFEVLERFEVKTAFVRPTPHLLIPLALPEVSLEWVLCNECYLRKVLPCDIFYAGLDAAKKIASWNKLAALYPPSAMAPSSAVGAAKGAASPYLVAVETVLRAWRVLRDAEILPINIEAMSDGGLATIAAGGQLVADGLEAITKAGSAAIATGTELIEAAGEKINEGLKTAGKAVTGVVDWFGDLFDKNAMAAPQIAGSLGGNATAGGPGSWLYREAAEIVAPQITDAFSFLETAWRDLDRLPSGEREIAELNILTIFFAKLGVPAVTFGKVDALFLAVAGGAVAGGAAVAALAALLLSLEAFGFADTAPDDEGLRRATERLKSLLDSAMAQAPATGLPSSGADTAGAQAAIEERWREQMKELAEAQVEFERLTCHINKNLLSYMQGLWGQWPDHQILAEVRRHGIPEEVISPRFVAFHGNLGALTVIDTDWLKNEGDLDWKALAKDLVKKAEAQVKSQTLTLPTAGMTVEPALGSCDACEPFIEDHRKLDIENRRAEVALQQARARQEGLEADRFAERLKSQKLDDPTPFEGSSVNIELERP